MKNDILKTLTKKDLIVIISYISIYMKLDNKEFDKMGKDNKDTIDVLVEIQRKCIKYSENNSHSLDWLIDNIIKLNLTTNIKILEYGN